jgi:hypothetical protein
MHKVQQKLSRNHPLVQNLAEFCLIQIIDIEMSIGLVWLPSVRDHFRHMWE